MVSFELTSITPIFVQAKRLSEAEGGTRRSAIRFPAFEFPAFEERAPEARSQVIQCVDPPHDTEDINWQRYIGESKVGCSTCASGLAVWLFLGIFGYRRRRNRPKQL